VSSATPERYVDLALETARCSAAVANFCDHVEHNETADRAWVQDAGHELRAMACAIATHEHEDLRALYVARLRAIEQRNPLWDSSSIDGGALAEQANTWRALQLAQAEHDRRYHPDVVGLSKFDQLRHYALHVAKLAGAVADMAQGLADPSDFRARRLPDMLLFGIKLATVTGQRLPETGLVEAVDERILVVA
jgi:hypothetical protein